MAYFLAFLVLCIINSAHSSPVKLEAYIESECPDCTEFIRHQLAPTYRVLKPNITLTIVVSGKAHCTPMGDDFKCECQHGPDECYINMVMNCVVDKYGLVDDYWPAIHCLQGQPITKAHHCLVKLFKEKVAREILHCAITKKGRKLLAEAEQKTKHTHLDFVPWLVIDGKHDPQAHKHLKATICDKLEPKPKACNQKYFM